MFPRLTNKQRTSENILYALLWICILLIPLLNAELTSQSYFYIDDVLTAWLKIAPFFLIFMVHNRYIAPPFLKSKRYGRYSIVTIGFILAVYVLVDILQENVFRYLPLERSSDGVKMTLTDISIASNMLFGLFMCSAHMGIKLIYKSMRDDQLMETLKHQKLQVEMDYLKYQVNPHFFMNTLNNIHALIDIDSESAKGAVIELSKMMRYVLYESSSDSIPLSRDFNFVENYIELMKIRYDGSVTVKMVKPEVTPEEAKLPPLLLIVFIENAFKHGVRAVGESFIDINISISGVGQRRELKMTVVNSLSNFDDRDHKRGIGLLNVRKRLELLYEKSFSLTAQHRESDYYVELKIPIFYAKNSDNR